MKKDCRKIIHDAAVCLGARIDTPLENHIMDAAIDEILHAPDPTKSVEMNAALSAVVDAKRTLEATQDTRDELEKSERA